MSISTTTVTIVSSNVGLSFKVILWVRSFGLRVRIVGVYSLILEDGYYRAVKRSSKIHFFHIWEALLQSVFWLNKNFNVCGFWRGLEFSFGGRTCLGSKFDILGLKGFEAYYYII